uniref:Uncharacterized protein n=1 Tax=Micrurus surinamensis TaxID=129470 RepID=A0A2D4Q0D4_MICSU
MLLCDIPLPPLYSAPSIQVVILQPGRLPYYGTSAVLNFQIWNGFWIPAWQARYLHISGSTLFSPGGSFNHASFSILKLSGYAEIQSQQFNVLRLVWNDGRCNPIGLEDTRLEKADFNLDGHTVPDVMIFLQAKLNQWMVLSLRKKAGLDPVPYTPDRLVLSKWIHILDHLLGTVLGVRFLFLKKQTKPLL